MTAALWPILSACALAASLAANLAACTDYLARRDTLTLGSGEAVQANIAMHTIDPWPPRSRRVDPYTDGERMQHAIERYRNPVVTPATGGAALSAPFINGTAPTASSTPSAPPTAP